MAGGEALSDREMDPEKNDADPVETPEEIRRRAGPYLGLGSMFLASVLVCTLGGWWIDGKTGTSPWLTVAGAVSGIGIGFYLFFKAVLPKDGSSGDWSE